MGRKGDKVRWWLRMGRSIASATGSDTKGPQDIVSVGPNNEMMVLSPMLMDALHLNTMELRKLRILKEHDMEERIPDHDVDY